MERAKSAQFAAAKRQALRAIAQMHPDEFVPDRVLFFNSRMGFTFRLSDMAADNHVERVVAWAQVENANFPIIEEEVSRAVAALARAQAAE